MSARQPPLSPRETLARRRAADQRLIDAIFGPNYEPMRAGEAPVAPAPAPRRPAPIAA